MIYTKGLKAETLEALSNLWVDENFQKLVEVLRTNQTNYANLCLTRDNWDDVRELQWKASAFSIVIKTVEEAYHKLNRPKHGSK